VTVFSDGHFPIIALVCIKNQIVGSSGYLFPLDYSVILVIYMTFLVTIQDFPRYIEQFRNPVGLLARQRKGELKKLNDQLRQINASLRRQAKIESYAPALSYAPAASKVPESEVIVDPHKQRLITYLRTGKNYLRNQAPDKAFPEFKTALDLAQSLGDHVEEKKAARGLGMFFVV
jgi:hypothetical protein